MWYRLSQLHKWHLGLQTDVSNSSLKRWREDVNPKRQTGNKSAATIVAMEHLLLAIFLLAYPEATHNIFRFKIGRLSLSIGVIAQELSWYLSVG